MSLKKVTDLLSEIEGITFRAFLEEEGIKSVIIRFEVPFYRESFTGDFMSVGASFHGRWGELLVEEEDYEKAVAVVEDIKRSMGISYEGG